jgi:hypothetical protein
MACPALEIGSEGMGQAAALDSGNRIWPAVALKGVQKAGMNKLVRDHYCDVSHAPYVMQFHSFSVAT